MATYGTREVAARKVRKGDFLSGLGNAYVVDVDKAAGPYEGHLRLTAHDDDGDEIYVEVYPETVVSVRTPREAFVG